MVRLEWITPNAEQMLIEMARVSTDPEKEKAPDEKLIATLIRGGHWSPLEMVNICIEVVTTRDIARQMLRHSTMRPQEFSQRYQKVDVLGEPIYREARGQHPTNRQMSIPIDDEAVISKWNTMQRRVWGVAKAAYNEALEMGLAKEVARVLLPEGMTPSRCFFNMPLRTALHFCSLRTLEHGAQEEIVEISRKLWWILVSEVPMIAAAYEMEYGAPHQ